MIVRSKGWLLKYKLQCRTFEYSTTNLLLIRETDYEGVSHVKREEV